MAERKRGTSTSNFGVGKRESHDASAFYARFEAPEFSKDDTVVRFDPPEPIVVGDSRAMDGVPDNSVALVVTSPPYYAGKAYEEELGEGHIPASYFEYLAMLSDVFAECARVLEPGGRIAVNVANLGRRPYRSLAADVIRILQDDLHLVLRGEIVWQKARGASGSCAWGTFGSAQNPVLRDITERVIVAGKGRLDRARSREQRAAEQLPHLDSITNDEYMAATLDVWELPTESARRVDHPAPFPVDLPRRFIELYTFEDDLVLDPFMGSGTTAVAAARTGRRFLGFDMDPAYVARARARVADELAAPQRDADVDEARDRGQAMSAIAQATLEEAGFTELRKSVTVPGMGLKASWVGIDAEGGEWWFDVSGAFTSPRTGLLRPETALAAVGRATAFRAAGAERVVLLTSWLPAERSPVGRSLRSGGPGLVFDAIEVLDPAGRARLAHYASGSAKAAEPGFWSASDLP